MFYWLKKIYFLRNEKNIKNNNKFQIEFSIFFNQQQPTQAPGCWNMKIQRIFFRCNLAILFQQESIQLLLLLLLLVLLLLQLLTNWYGRLIRNNNPNNG